MKAVDTGKIALREQLLFCFQPMLHIAPWLRALILIIQICPPGYLVR